ncbi:MAG: AI-2E family transporter [Candidatus Aquicultorales bacterium]
MELKRLRLHVPDWLKAIALLVALFLLYRFASVIVNTIVFFFVGAILAYVLHPFVNWLVKKGIPRGAAVTVVLITSVLVLVLFFLLVTPSLSSQIQEFSSNLPRIAQKLGAEYERFRRALPDGVAQFLPAEAESLYGRFVDFLQTQSERLLGFVPSIISAVAGIFIVVIFAIYILLHLEEIDSWFRLWVPEEYHWLYDRFVGYLDVGYGRYIVGQIIVSVTFGITVGAVMAIFGLPFPVILGIWAGIIQIIPIIGPAIAIVPPILLAFIESLRTGIAMTILLLLITGMQGVLLTPYILGATITISPIIILFFIIAGAEIGGVGGTILAVPFLVALNLVWQFIRENIYYGPGVPPPRPMVLTIPPPEGPPREKEGPTPEESEA